MNCDYHEILERIGRYNAGLLRRRELESFVSIINMGSDDTFYQISFNATGTASLVYPGEWS